LGPYCVYVTHFYVFLCISIREHVMSGTFKPLSPPGTRSRIRISSGMIGVLGWNSFQADFQCLGLFRGREELLCAPIELTCESGDHPFADVTAIILSTAQPEQIPSLRSIPPVRNLIASDRLISFGASWANESQSQLDLNLGAEITGRLGWSKQASTARPIYVSTYGGILIAISERRFLKAQEEDLTESSD